MTLFEAVRAAALVLEPQIAILCVAVFIAARWRGIRNMHSGLIIAAGINVSAMALNVAVFANGPALLASLVAQIVCVAWWLVSLIRGIRERDEWEARIERAERLLADTAKNNSLSDRPAPTPPGWRLS